MNCDEFDQAIFDFIDGALPSASRAAIEAHARNCARCCETAHQAQALDATLAATLVVEPLPADFERLLEDRIRAESVVLAADERADRRRRLEEEYAEAMAGLRHGWLDSETLSEWLGCIALAAAGGWLAWWLIAHWLHQLASLDTSSVGIQLLTPALAGALFLALGLAAAFPPLRRRLVAYLVE